MAEHMTHMELKEINNKPNTLLSATISCFPAGENRATEKSNVHSPSIRKQQWHKYHASIMVNQAGVIFLV